MDTQQRATRIANLERELVDVERQLIELHQGLDIEEPRQPPPPLPPPPPPVARPEPHEPEPKPGPDFARVEWLLRVGGIGLVVLAAIFFVSTAISRGWIGPTAQLTLATITSIGFIAQSFRFELDKRPWTITFAGGGLSALFASGVVGYTGLDLLSFPAAFAWLSVCALGFLLFSRLHDSQLLAWLSAPAVVIGAGLVHIIHDGGFTLPAFLGAAYAAALAVTTLRRDWSVARVTGATVAAILGFLGVFVGVLEKVDTITLTAAAILVIVGIGAVVVQQAADYFETDGALMLSARSFEARVMAAFIPWTATILALVVSSLDSTISSKPGVVFALVGLAGGAATLARSSIHATVRLLHQVAAIGTICIGAAIELEGPALLVVLAVNAAVTAVLAVRSRSVEMTAAAALLVAFTFVGFAAFTMMGAFEASISLGESFATAVVLAGVLIGSVVLYNDENTEGAWILALVTALAWILAHRLAFPQGDMIVSLGWATVGAGCVVGGARLGDRLIIQAGLLTLAATTAKLFAVDLASVDVLWRAGLFFVIGGMFLRLGFLVPKLLTGAETASETESDDASLA